MNSQQELVDKLLLLSLVSSAPKKPGAIIERLTKEEKELLKNLRAEHFQRRIK